MVCTKNCLDCLYYGGHSENGWCCNYIIMEDKRRPCPAGDGCTVKKQRKRLLKSWRDYTRRRDARNKN